MSKVLYVEFITLIFYPKRASLLIKFVSFFFIFCAHRIRRWGRITIGVLQLPEKIVMVDEKGIFVALLIGNLRKIFHMKIICRDDCLSFTIVEGIQMIFVCDLIGIPWVFHTHYLSGECFIFKFQTELAELFVYLSFSLEFLFSKGLSLLVNIGVITNRI